jgi:hypothetical protein
VDYHCCPTVLLAGTGDNPLRISTDAVAAIFVCIFILGINESENGLHGIVPPVVARPRLQQSQP